MLCFSCFPYSSAAEQWQLEADEHGVQIFSKKTDSGYIEVKAQTEVPGEPFALLALLDDTENGPQWIAHAMRVEVLDWFGNSSRTVQTFFSAPWPFANRDMVTHAQIDIDHAKKAMQIVIKDVGTQHFERGEYVRMRNVSGHWHTSMTESGNVKIVYQGYGEPAGSIPAWLANHLLIKSSLQTFINLRTIIQRPKYQVQITE